MDKRILDPLPPQYWLLRILTFSLISVPLTIGTGLVIPWDWPYLWQLFGLNDLVLIYLIYCLWTLLISIASRLRESHNLSGDLSKILTLTMMTGLVIIPLLYLILYFWEQFPL